MGNEPVMDATAEPPARPEAAALEPWLAAIWASSFPGLGHAYAGQVRAGWWWGGSIVALVLVGLAYYTLPGLPVLAGYACYALAGLLLVLSIADAHACARRTRSSEAEADRHSRRDACKAAFLNLLIAGVGSLYDRQWWAGVGLLLAMIVAAGLPDKLEALVDATLACVGMVHAGGSATSRIDVGAGTLKRVAFIRLGIVAVALLMTIGIAATLVRAFKMPSGSMTPLLVPGDRFLADMTRHGHAAFGEVVVFRHTGRPSGDFAKRVIGIPGDTLAFDRAHVWRNGRSLCDGPCFGSPGGEGPGDLPAAQMVVPDGHVFVLSEPGGMGGLDSRAFGPVPFRAIRGRVYKLYWPLGRARSLVPRADGWWE